MRSFLAGTILFVFIASECFSSNNSHAQSFQALGVGSDARGVSGNGSVAVGCSSLGCGLLSQATSWNVGGGFAGLGYLPGYNWSEANGANATGSVVVGSAFGTVTGQAFSWTAAGGMVGLGYLPGNTQSWASSASANGAVVVGYSSQNGGSGSRAVSWTGGAGPVALSGSIPGNTIAFGVSATGSVIVGTNYNEAFRWTSGTGMLVLPAIAGHPFGEALGVSANGSAVVGVDFAASRNQDQAFLWTAHDGTEGLGYLPRETNSIALATNFNGSIVVGGSSNDKGSVAFIWSAATGMRSIKDILIADGINVRGWKLEDAYGISYDGSVITGDGIDPQGNPEAWIARIPLASDVPEPSTWAMLLIGFAAIGFAGYRNQVRLDRSVGGLAALGAIMFSL